VFLLLDFDKVEESIFISLLLAQSFQLLVPLGLLLGLVDEVSDGVAAQDLLGVEDLVEVFLQLFATFLDVFRAFVGDSKDLLLGKGGPS
jgi:hypothetical protein